MTAIREFQHKISSRTSLNRLLNKVDSGDVSKDRKIYAVRGLLEEQEILCLLDSQASGISEWWRCLECVLQQNGGHIKWRNDVDAVKFS